MNLAPIILFVYNRPWHTKQTLEALMQNELADVSTLYIFCDGPKPDASEGNLNYIKEVRAVIREKQWCKEVIIVERLENLGLANSVIQGVTEVIEKHRNVIVLEDDIVTGTYFLKFMNDGLNIYEKEEKVFGISGYKYPSISEIKEKTYFLPIGSSWGYATWANRWNKVNFNGRELLDTIDRNNLKNKMNFGEYQFYQMLKDQIEGRNDSWAIRFYSSMFLMNGFFLYPNISLVENIGFDNSGIHCGKDDYFSNFKITNEKVPVIKLSNSLNKKVVNLVRQSFKLRNVNKIAEIGWNLKKRNLIKSGKSIIKKLFGKQLYV